MKRKLEKFMYMGFGAVIALGGYFFGTLHSDQVDAQSAPANVEYNVIRCRGLTVVDEDGIPRISLGTLKNKGTLISISDENGIPRIALIHANDGDSSIKILDGNHKLRARLKCGTDNRGEIAIMDENSNVKALLSTTTDGKRGVIASVDENGITQSLD